MKPSKVLEKAAEIQVTRGHCKGTLQDAEGRVCLQGALFLACGITLDHDGTPSFYSSPMSARLFDQAHLYVYRHLGSGSHRWNDLPTTSGEDVVQVLRAAAALAREDELVVDDE